MSPSIAVGSWSIVANAVEMAAGDDVAGRAQRPRHDVAGDVVVSIGTSLPGIVTAEPGT